jgi:sterol desaturase/sphingolipid hydroxylase (fatty acid hydroxylase superfamily)
VKRKDSLFYLILLIGLAAAFVTTLGYPSRARLFPIIVISLCGVFVLWALVKMFIARHKASSLDEYRQKNEKTLKPDEGYRRQSIFAFAWIGAFVLLLWLLGFVVGLPLFAFAYIKTYEEGWRLAIISTIIIFLITYVVFAVLLKIPLYEGLLFR